MEWQPIETAPKDGSWVFVWSKRTSWVSDLNCMVAFYDDESEDWYECEADSRPLAFITHWMPLPGAPS